MMLQFEITYDYDGQPDGIAVAYLRCYIALCSSYVSGFLKN